MKYVITGGAGNISKPLTEKLLNAGHEVTVIGRNAEHLKVLTDQGAKAATGSVEDIAFLKSAFAGANVLIPWCHPNGMPQIGKHISGRLERTMQKQ